MMRRLMLAAALAVGFAGAAAAAPVSTSTTALPDNVAVAFAKKGGHPAWGHRGGRGHHYGWKKQRRHYGWNRGRHRGWR
jgi:hypothetical protein